MRGQTIYRRLDVPQRLDSARHRRPTPAASSGNGQRHGARDAEGHDHRLAERSPRRVSRVLARRKGARLHDVHRRAPAGNTTKRTLGYLPFDKTDEARGAHEDALRFRTPWPRSIRVPPHQRRGRLRARGGGQQTRLRARGRAIAAATPTSARAGSSTEPPSTARPSRQTRAPQQHGATSPRPERPLRGRSGHAELRATVNPVPSGGYAWVVFTSRRMYGNVATINPWCWRSALPRHLGRPDAESSGSPRSI